MNTYYIVAGPTGGVNKVWAHHGIDGGSPGCWARDIDAAYLIREFGFRSERTAARRALQIFNTGRGDPSSPHIFVVDRERLFDLLELDDWSHGA